MNVNQLSITAEQAEALLVRAKGALTLDVFLIIKGLVDTHLLLQQAVLDKAVTVKRLVRMIFGHKTEKSDRRRGTGTNKGKDKNTGEKQKKGHGKNGADNYLAATTTISVHHTTLTHCDPCPACPDGKVYRLSIPGTVVRITGGAPLTATIFAPEKLRCNICGRIFTAGLPNEAGPAKYNETAAAMIAVLRYGIGVPLHRLAGLQAALGVPLPASTAWDVLEKAVDHIHPAFSELIRHGAQANVVHNDDTNMKMFHIIVDCPPSQAQSPLIL